MTKPHSPCSVDNRYDGPLLTDTPQYIFITRAVKKFLSGSLIMNSRQLWNLHQRHKFLRTEASRDILEFRVSETPFPGVFKRYFSTTDAMLLRQNTCKIGNNAVEMSQVFHYMTQYSSNVSQI